MHRLSLSADQESVGLGRTLDDMVVSAGDVAAVLRERVPGLSQTKEHKLL
jgi:hypothetical protein